MTTTDSEIVDAIAAWSSAKVYAGVIAAAIGQQDWRAAERAMCRLDTLIRAQLETELKKVDLEE